MTRCLDCGEEVERGKRYCPFCGSPTEIMMPSEEELRRDAFNYNRSGSNLRTIILALIVIILLGLLVIIMYLSKSMNSQMAKMGAGF